MIAPLDALSLPNYPDLQPDVITTALDEALDQLKSTIETVVQAGSLEFEESWMPIERASIALDAIWSAVAHMKAVADTPELRAVYVAGQARVAEASTAMMQDRRLYDLFVAMAATEGFAARSQADRAAVERMLTDFRRSGVALEPEQRQRFAELSMELSSLSVGFTSAVLDATEAWSEHVTDEALLAGLPAASTASMAAAAKAAGLNEGWLISLRAPDFAAVMTYAEDRGLRERVYRAFGIRASELADEGKYDNSARIERILALRKEMAGLLGFPDFVAMSLETKMATDAETVLGFLRDLAARARPEAENDLAQLRAYAADLGIDDMQPWDSGLVANKLRLARHAFDEQAVRAYLPVDHVLAGWRDLLAKLFGIDLVAREDVAVWHPDARYYDVADADGAVIGGIYVDLFARSGKNGGAWMAPARPRLNDGAAQRVPVAYLVCNFPPHSDDSPALLSHGEVQTLLHETGHALHHILSQVDRPSVAGTSGFEWDAIELPSQLMEDFAWDRDVITAMSHHVETGETLPAELFDRMSEARHFQSALMVLRQIELAMFDLQMHLNPEADAMTVLQEVRDEVAVITPPEWHRLPHSFMHIFANAYAAGYYSYLWAEVLAADGFQYFVEHGTLSHEAGEQFRAQILSQGAVRPAADSFRAFRGREPDSQAMLIRRGLAA